MNEVEALLIITRVFPVDCKPISSAHRNGMGNYGKNSRTVDTIQAETIHQGLACGSKSNSFVRRGRNLSEMVTTRPPASDAENDLKMGISSFQRGKARKTSLGFANANLRV